MPLVTMPVVTGPLSYRTVASLVTYCPRRVHLPTALPRDITERPHAPSGVAVFMSAHRKTPYITPGMDFYSGKGVVRGRRGEAAGICLAYTAPGSPGPCTRRRHRRPAPHPTPPHPHYFDQLYQFEQRFQYFTAFVWKNTPVKRDYLMRTELW